MFLNLVHVICLARAGIDNVHLGFSTRDGMFQDACGCAAVAVVSAIRLPRSAEGGDAL